MEPEDAVTGYSQTKDTRLCAGQWRAAGGSWADSEPWVFANASWAPIPHRPQLGGLASADIPGWAQLAELASQTGEDLGLQLQWSPACAKAAGTCVALASLVPLVPRRGRGSSEMLHSSFVLLLFSRESLILKQYFRFCLCSVSAKVTCCVK